MIIANTFTDLVIERWHSYLETAIIHLKFFSIKPQVGGNRAFAFYIVEGNKEYRANDITYFIDKSSDSANVRSVNINRNKLVSLVIDLTNAEINNRAYHKEIYLKLYDITSDQSIVAWQSPKLKLVSAQMELPEIQTSYVFGYNHGQVDSLSIKTTLGTKSQKNFIKNFTGFTMEWRFIDYANQKLIETTTITPSAVNQITFSNPYGGGSITYEIVAILKYTSGLEAARLSTIIKPVNAKPPIFYKFDASKNPTIVHHVDREVIQVLSAHVKTPYGIKKIQRFEAND